MQSNQDLLNVSTQINNDNKLLFVSASYNGQTKSVVLKFYDMIKHKEFTTAALQEFLFYNRDCDDILTIIDKLIKIIDNNDPKNFEIVKDENKNFYS